MLKLTRNIPKRFNSCKSLLQHRSYSSMQVSQMKLEEAVSEEAIESNLAHGKVTIWTRGDQCINTGKNSQKVKKLLIKNNIEYQENII